MRWIVQQAVLDIVNIDRFGQFHQESYNDEVDRFDICLN